MSELADTIANNQSHQYCDNGVDWTDCAGNVVPRSARVADTTIFAGCGVSQTVCHFAVNDFPSNSRLFNQMDRFFDPGLTYTNSISVAHRAPSTNFRASYADTKENGILPFLDGYRRRSVRINVDHNIAEDFRFRSSGYYSQSSRDGTADAGGPFFAFTFVAPDVDLLELNDPARDENDFVIQPDPDVNRANPVYELANRVQTQTRSRVLGNFGATWTPLGWFDLEGDFSFDRSDRNNFDFRDVGFRSIGGSLADGRIREENFVTQALNVNGTAAARWSLGKLSGVSKVRVAAERTENTFFEAFGQGLNVAEVPDLDNAGGTVNIGSSSSLVKSLGYFFITGLDYDDKYIGDFLVRRDGSSLFGPDERWQTYFRASGAYRLSEENWWPFDVLDEFKVRASYGTAGGRPQFNAQFETFDVTGGNISKRQLGNKDLKPEFVKEFETGVDLIAAGRFSLGVTYAKSISEDQILSVPLPGAAGFRNQWKNAGTLESKTWEASLQASLIQTRDVTWSWNVVWDRTRQVITELNVPPYRWGAGNQGGFAFFNRPNEEFGVMYGFRWVTGCDEMAFYSVSAADCAANFQVNDDGYMVAVGGGNNFTDGISGLLWGTSVEAGDNNTSFSWGMPIKALGLADPIGDAPPDTTDIVRMGRATPDWNFGFSQNFRFKGLSLYTLFDGQVGGNIYNQTRQWNMSEDASGINDQSGKEEGLVKPIDYVKVLYATLDPNSELVESGTYMKLRELSLRYTFNQGQLQGLFGGAINRVSVALIGRNLITWTSYTGFDPEVGRGGNQASITRFDAFNYPNFRTYTASVEFEF